MMKKFTTALLLMIAYAPSVWAQRSISVNRTKNEATGKIELCYHHLLYSSSTEEERECLVGHDESPGGDFVVESFLDNGLRSLRYFCEDHATAECKRFGYERAHLEIRNPRVGEILGDGDYGNLGIYTNSDCSGKASERREWTIFEFKCLKKR